MCWAFFFIILVFYMKHSINKYSNKLSKNFTVLRHLNAEVVILTIFAKFHVTLCRPNSNPLLTPYSYKLFLELESERWARCEMALTVGQFQRGEGKACNILGCRAFRRNLIHCPKKGKKIRSKKHSRSITFIVIS